MASSALFGTMGIPLRRSGLPRPFGDWPPAEWVLRAAGRHSVPPKGFPDVDGVSAICKTIRQMAQATQGGDPAAPAPDLVEELVRVLDLAEGWRASRRQPLKKQEETWEEQKHKTVGECRWPSRLGSTEDPDPTLVLVMIH